MRLFTEHDVIVLAGTAQSMTGVKPEDLIASAIKAQLVTPIVVRDMDGERLRAFTEWTATGEIPDWRQRQIEDAAVGEAVNDVLRDTSNDEEER